MYGDYLGFFFFNFHVKLVLATLGISDGIEQLKWIHILRVLRSLLIKHNKNKIKNVFLCFSVSQSYTIYRQADLGLFYYCCFCLFVWGEGCL